MASTEFPPSKMDIDGDDDDDDDNFNLIQPTLFQQIKTILDQYPDDGQILKELIQNAEDARASQVKFLYDKHSYRADKLYSEGLSQFQGPALYAYNDAQFTKDDWKGIRMLCDSVKVKDPMKVGRFGLGFKSVFHMTDLPSILSGTKIGFIDPHEDHFNDGPRERRTGYRWRLSKDREKMNRIPDQFLPYKGIFDCTEKVFSLGHYSGTLFRFPLRTTRSELSQTVYSDEKVDSLFKSFCADAHLVLLFLHHLESVELYVRDKSESESRKIFQAKIGEDSLEFVREKRREFYSSITPGERMLEPVRVTYPITIEVARLSEDSTERHSFLVTSYCCGGEVSSKFEKLLTDKELSYLPSVGVAMAIPSEHSLPTPDIQGHVFCALPLPVQKKSLTGLPVHVNGFFSLSQNRRHIKTPNADQEDPDKLTDKSLMWNTCLLEEALPKAYATLIMEAINHRSFNVPPEAIYRAWPDIDSVEPTWNKLQDPLFLLLISERVIHTHAHGGNWLKVNEAVFDEKETKELIVRVLLQANQNVASLPNHVLKAIDSYAAALCTKVTPSLVRRVLKETPTCYKSLSSIEKLCLLKFVLSDDNFQELVDIELLPVSDGTLTSFTNSKEAVYITSSQHPQKLVPGLKDRFLDQDVDESTLRKLKAVAEKGCTQLRLLGKGDVPSLLREALPLEWLSSDKVEWYPDDEKHTHPPKYWLTTLWHYMRENYFSKDELCSLGEYNLPLIPVDLKKVPVTLVTLKKPSKVVVKRLNDDYLDDAVVNALTELGVVVMHECPNSFHPALAETFVHPPSISGVLQAMMVSSSTLGNGMLSAIMLEKVGRAGTCSLRKFISNALSLKFKEKQLISCLPLFETLSKKFVAKKDCLCAAPEETLPVTPRRDLIDIKEEDSKRLAQLLDITIPTLTELLCKEIFPDVSRGHYTGEQIDCLMSFVMERYRVFVRRDAGFEEKLKDLLFVPNSSRRMRASDLFDPQNETLKALFADEDVFPVGKLYTDPSVLVILKGLGMKSEEMITAQNLYQSALKIMNNSSISTAKQKSQALLDYLSKNPMKLQDAISGEELGLLLKDIPWVTTLKEKPSEFPRSLHFWGEGNKERNFCKPTEVKGREHLNLIGSVKPIFEVEPSSQLSSYFGWNKKPRLSDVVDHLKTVITDYSKDERPRYSLLVKDIYDFLVSGNRGDVVEAIKGVEDTGWIWNGDGFSSPNVVVSEKPSIDLSPYISALPVEMVEYSELFFHFGMHKQCNAPLMLDVLAMIKDKYDQNQFEITDVKKDLQLCIAVLNEVKPGNGEQLPPEVQEKILLPTYVKEDAFVKLAPVEDCMYGEHEGLETETDDGEMDFLMVHPNIPAETAELLNVRSLSNCLLDPDELALGEEFGQEEKLTRRLNRLLEEYADGFAVPKELIQNADDAGATEVSFLYDERTNDNAMTGLIDEGMKHCQGPALWAYNDAEFKDEDFENITKLNGATKENYTEKIGKFGLGFNAVYNLTDVPMFVSRNHFVILDPNTFYLGKQIRNKNKPGVKLDTNKNVRRLRRFRNQFRPFNGIFGCDLHLDKEDNSYQGTLFRFPLRTKEQAIQSEIRKLVYDWKQVRELLKRFIHGAGSLLLFTQNVLRISIFHLTSDATEPLQPTKIFEVTKSLSKSGILRELLFSVTPSPAAHNLNAENQFLLKQCNFLRASSEVTKQTRDSSNSTPNLLSSALTININSTITEYGDGFFEDSVSFSGHDDTWLVVSSMGKGEAMKFSEKDKSLLASAGVAVQLFCDGSSGSNGKANVFCYLPLPIHSGLPAHINGAFAVSSNRRSLLVKTDDDKANFGEEWNSVLLKDSVCTAYLDLLEDLKSVSQVSSGTYRFHSLWPKCEEVASPCEPLARSFYGHLANGNNAIFSDGNSWVTINEVVFLDPELREDTEVGDLYFEVFKLLAQGNEAVIDLPRDVFKSFVEYGLAAKIQPRTYNKSRFFRELFFPKITSVPSDLRDNLILYALKSEEFSDLINTVACIPVSPDGHKLKCPSQLVHPRRYAALLFCPEDERFPFGTEETFLNPRQLLQLEQLGMSTDDLPWSEVVERAESIYVLSQHCRNAALERAERLTAFLDKKLERDEKVLPSATVQGSLLAAKFLPVLMKPHTFPLAWKGSKFVHGNELGLVSPTEGFLKTEMYLVCCTVPIIGLLIPKNVKRLLQFDIRQVTTMQVMSQLSEAISTEVDISEIEEVKTVCNACYSFLQDAPMGDTAQIASFLEGKNFILIGNKFACAKQVAFSLPVDCSPYLYELTEELARYSGLMKAGGVRDVFEVKDFISALQQIKEKFGERRVDNRTLPVAINLAIQLKKALETPGVQYATDDKRRLIHLPNSEGIMRPVSELCIKDCPWIPGGVGIQFVHADIPCPTSIGLGVKTRREEAVGSHARGLSFGQKEKLTNRLKRILAGYPCGKELLKELLQNADDAQATEICFIKDPRHHPKERLFHDSWQPLQGPALCVYNNKPFTNADIEGIQNLGEGSKGDDPNKTGQYGVGFNAVYHLTDIPSFMSKGDEIGDVLCVFDPHCRYVPGANPQEPGRMYTETTTLKEVFPHVFRCYLEETFPIENSTMFRFPLRTQEMAYNSDLSSTPFTLEALNEMMEALKNELFEVLVFINSVRKITLCDIDERTGDVVNSYSVEAIMSKEDAAKRQQFVNYVKQAGKSGRQKSDFSPNNIGVEKCSYVLNLKDSIGNEEKWLIVQQIGFENIVQTRILNAFRNRDLGMLPRGGVACLLETKSMEPEKRKKRAYCFLPLPLETDLPVHINGHFALDHETRRNLWVDENGGYRSDWNNALLSDVITSCYLTLLDEVRSFFQLPASPLTSTVSLSCTKDELILKLVIYENLFPRTSSVPYWAVLVKSVYHGMSKKELRFLPVVRDAPDGIFQGVELTWLPPSGTGRDKAFFNNLGTSGCYAGLPVRGKDDSVDKERASRRASFEKILLETGFNLVQFSLKIFKAFENSQVKSYCISPSSVMEFYKTSLCNIPSLPIDVAKTPFKGSEGVTLILQYCKDHRWFLNYLSDLPLLLTQDNCLRVFSSTEPKFLSLYHDILPKSKRLFVHEQVVRKIFYDVIPHQVSVFKSFDVNAFAQHLSSTLSPQYSGANDCVTWCPENTVEPNRHWLFRVWSFLAETWRSTRRDPNRRHESTASHIVMPLFNWSILPATEEIVMPTADDTKAQDVFKRDVLVPVKLANCVLDFTENDPLSGPLVKALRALGLPELDSNFLCTLDMPFSILMDSCSLARQIVGSLKTPASLIASFNHKLCSNPQSLVRKLERSDCITILKYFNNSVQSMPLQDRSTLRKLPFYPTTSGDIISIATQRVCVLPSEMPRQEMDVMQKEVDMAFLEDVSDLSDLYRFLAFECFSPVDVYCEFILVHFNALSKEARHTHLEYIKETLLPSTKKSSEDEQKLLYCLKTTKVVTTQKGTLKPASSFYDPRNKVFKAMLPENMFPPAPYKSKDWLAFLIQIGMIDEVNPEHFKTFAKQVALEAGTQRTMKTDEKSKLLVSELLSRSKLLSDGHLKAVSDIEFVISDPVCGELQALHGQHGERGDGKLPYIAFRDTVVSDHTESVWTSAYLLPQSADPRFQSNLRVPCQFTRESFCSTILGHLKVLSQPTSDMVISHCRNISFQIVKENGNNVSEKQCGRRKSVMKSIYNFLQEKVITKTVVNEDLKDVPCIVVEEGIRFVKAKQVVLELSENLEIKPFLYRVPHELGEFHKLFHHLGCSKFATMSHYAMVLEMLEEHCRGSKLLPNEIKSALKAVRGLVEGLQQDTTEDISSQQLFLPAVYLDSSKPDSLPVTLHKSTELIFNDAPHLQPRLENFKQLFVVDLKEAEVQCSSSMNYKDLIMRLPPAVQPQMLSCVVKEEFADSSDGSKLAVKLRIADSLKKQLCSEQFFRGILRLIRHANHENGTFDNSVVASIEDRLRSIDFLGMNRIETKLLFKDDHIPGSEAEVPYFVNKDSAAADRGIWKVYVSTEAEDNLTKIYLAVTQVIAEACEGLLREAVMFIPEMLRNDPSQIWSMLDEMKVRQDDSYNGSSSDILPQPGSFIPIEDHHLLNEGFEKLTPGEYVGYEMEDPSMQQKEEDATFVYAVIMEEVDVQEGTSIFAKFYKINVGHDKEPQVVEFADLYKFHRLQSLSLGLSDQHGISTQPGDKNKIFVQISDILVEAWRLPEIRRRKVVKRLYLRWHPEKNPGDETFCAEALQHIQNEIARLESAEANVKVDQSSYHPFFNFWRTRARRHHAQRRGYRENFLRIYGSCESVSRRDSSSSIPPTFCKKNPQPGEAKRWLRQAEADLVAASNDLATSKPSYEWACFKCHQSAEKALKAAQYADDAFKTRVHDLTCNASRLQDSQLSVLANDLERRVVGSARMRYPDRVCYPQIPNDVYSVEAASEALELANAILERVRNLVPK